MSHLMTSTASLPGYEHINRVGVGANVKYHIQTGRQRQGRDVFPAVVLQQHMDDGSLDLLVFFEPEELLWERRVMPYTEAQPGRCWSPVENQPFDDGEAGEAERSLLHELAQKIFGPYNEPSKSVMEYLADFDVRLHRLEQGLLNQGAKKGK